VNARKLDSLFGFLTNVLHALITLRKTRKKRLEKEKEKKLRTKFEVLLNLYARNNSPASG